MAHFFSDGAVADNTTFVVVGAAAVLGAACRAPLTAIALMVEISRDTGLLVPLLAAIGTASVVTDYLVSGLRVMGRRCWGPRASDARRSDGRENPKCSMSPSLTLPLPLWQESMSSNRCRPSPSPLTLTPQEGMFSNRFSPPAFPPLQEGMFSKWLERQLVEMYLKEKAMFWGAGLVSDAAAKEALGGPKDAGE